jgi:hypothetical protein
LNGAIIRLLAGGHLRPDITDAAGIGPIDTLPNFGNSLCTLYDHQSPIDFSIARVRRGIQTIEERRYRDQFQEFRD